MRFLLSLATAVLACAAMAQEVKFKVSIQGQNVGEAKMRYSILPNKGVRTVLNLKLGQAFTMDVDESTKGDGFPDKSTSKDSTPSEKKTIVKTYGAKELTVALTKDGKTTTTKYPYPKNGTIKAEPDLWFLTVRPKVGQKYTYWVFDNSKMDWKQATRTYVGEKPIIVKGKTVKAHLMESEEADIWVDEKGIPYKMELKQEGAVVLFERV